MRYAATQEQVCLFISQTLTVKIDNNKIKLSPLPPLNIRELNTASFKQNNSSYKTKRINHFQCQGNHNSQHRPHSVYNASLSIFTSS